MKRELLLERDMLMFDAWDALTKGTALADEGILRFNKAAATKLTIRVYGRIGISDLTGKPIVEDMKVMLGDSDIYDSLPESLLREFEDAAIEEAA